MTGEGATDAESVAVAEDAVRFRMLAVDLDLSAFTRTLGFRARLEQAGDVEPDVEADRVAHMSMSTLALAFSVSTNASV